MDIALKYGGTAEPAATTDHDSSTEAGSPMELLISRLGEIPDLSSPMLIGDCSRFDARVVFAVARRPLSPREDQNRKALWPKYRFSTLSLRLVGSKFKLL